MYKFPIALQLYSVRDELENDFNGTLKKVKAMGYDGVEFAGIMEYTAEEVKAMCKDNGLVPLSAHVPYEKMIDSTDEYMKTYSDIGCKFIVIPYLTEEYRPGHEKFNEVIKGAEILGRKAKEYGMTLCYHNHDFEFTKVNGEYALDVLYKEVPADLLHTQLDTCWVSVGGENPADYIRKYKGRQEIVHLKDYAGRKSENMYKLIGIDENKKADESKKFELRPVGYGVQDFNAILKACEEVGMDWVIVEQDCPSMDKSPLECVEMSIKYLKTICE